MSCVLFTYSKNDAIITYSFKTDCELPKEMAFPGSAKPLAHAQTMF
jgi:hypothetical protein